MIPKVSIIIPYKSDRGFLEQALDSIYDQDYPNVERVLSQSDYGVSFNINQGIKKATGEYIKYLCDDDWLPNNSISKSVEAIQGFDFIHGQAIPMSSGKAGVKHVPANHHPTCKELARRNFIHGATLMYRRDVFDRFGWFDEKMWTGEELEFNLRILSQGAKIGYCPHVVAYYRIHRLQKSTGNKSQAWRNKRIVAIKSMRKKYL
jgi:glycosyltransferase involved in cell wall biosynthesis